MDRIGQCVGNRLAIGEDRAEIEQRGLVHRHRHRSRPQHDPGDDESQQRPRRRKAERPVPVQRRLDLARDEERQAGPDAEARRVERNAAALQVGRQAVCQRLQSGHIGTGEGDPLQATPQAGAPHAVGGNGEAHGRRDGERHADKVDAAGVPAVGQADQDRHGGDVAREVDAADPARLGVAESPFRLNCRQQPGKSGEGGHAEHFRETDGGKQEPGRQVTHGGRSSFDGRWRAA